MGYFGFSLLLVSLPSAAIFLQSCFFAEADVDLIQRTCRITNNYDLCLSYLHSDPQSLGADTTGLAIIILNKASSTANQTSSFITKLIKKYPDTAMKNVLKDCSSRYSDAYLALRDSIQSVDSELYDYANLHVTAASEYCNYCRGLFKKNLKLIYPVELSRREEALEHLCAIASNIITLLIV